MATPSPIYETHDKIVRECPEWLWPGRIPKGKITIIMGDPGTGKSYATLSWACIVSSGGKWPSGEGCEESRVIILTDEDDVNDTVGPRIDVMGGKRENIIQFYGVQREAGSATAHFSFARDLKPLEELIVEKQASLMIIDPISAYLGYIDSFKESDVRETLTPLASLASRTGCAIVGIAHMNKNQETKAVYRVGGSIAFTALARAVHLIAKDPDDPERRVMLPVKLNVAEEPQGVAYHLEDATHPLGFQTARVVWDGKVDDTIEDVIGEMENGDRRDAVVTAETFLEELFDGTMELPQRMVEQAAKEGRIPMTALNRAKRSLGVSLVRKGRFWWWVKGGKEAKGDV